MARSDFNGDGRSDMLWVRIGAPDSGFIHWLGRANGGFSVNNSVQVALRSAGNWPGGVNVVGIGDFNGDSRADVLVRDDQVVTIWDGTAAAGFVRGVSLPPAPIAQFVVATGDFNGDGRDDILWREPWGGNLATSLMAADGSVTKTVVDPFVDPTWQIAATGDFDGDGRDDILWRHWQGAVSDWLGKRDGSFAINDANAMAQVGTDWWIVGTGDFNGDGRDDILWRNDDGTLSNWLATASGGFTVNDAKAMSHVPNAWRIQGIGDYNGDGRDDIFWLSDGGATSDWLGTAGGGFAINDANALASELVAGMRPSELPSWWNDNGVYSLY